NEQNQSLTSTVSVTDPSLVFSLGQQTDGTLLIKLVGDPDRFNFTLVPNSAPLVNADALSITAGATANVNVVGNDGDADGTLNLSSLAITQAPTKGTATANSDGTVTYVHNGTAGATDSFKYTIADNQGTVSAAAQVTIAVNQRPTAIADSAALAKGATTTINVATNDTDSDGTLNLGSIVITQQPAHGTAVVNANGTVTYLHDNSAATIDSFSYKINDNLGAQSAAAAVVSIAISAAEGEADLFGGLADEAHFQAVDSVLADEEDWML
ncbi:MAG: cadherin-like domain-containing protein, partial [Pirellulaceae bacterium]|nr:cadherin-like domain-containing protein [Pirellulaceae bacterium]